MTQEGPINFKALRAKFQKEGFLQQARTSRPAVVEKPKHVLTYGAHHTAAVGGTNGALENDTVVGSRVIFRDGLRSSTGKRPISHPPPTKQSSLPSEFANGDGPAKNSFRDRGMPLVLPAPPVSDHKGDGPVENEYSDDLKPGKEVMCQTKIKKKGLLLPFKSVSASRCSAEDGEVLKHMDHNNRSPLAPGELSLAEKQSVEDRVSLQSDQSASENAASSPDFPITPPPAESPLHFDSKILSTLEKAKKRLSRRQVLIPTKSKSTCSPDLSCRDKMLPSPLKGPSSPGADVPVSTPVCLPHLVCISARPFSKANNSARKPAFDKLLAKDKAGHSAIRSIESISPQAASKKLLPDMGTQGPVPAKPPRPPVVDLSPYIAFVAEEVPPACETASKEEKSEPSPVSDPLLRAPEIPDFENSEVEICAGEAVDIAALELEALEIVGSNKKAPNECQVTNWDALESAPSPHEAAETAGSSVIQDLNLGSPDIIPLDPACFPEPTNMFEFPEPEQTEQPSHCKDGDVDLIPESSCGEADVGEPESRSVSEEADLFMGQSTSNYDSQIHSSESLQNSYYETSDNVYEDVESFHKGVSSQIAHKQKCRLKNPYVENEAKKQEPRLNKRLRHQSKEHTSPNTADLKEQKKREKQRLDRERKEQKEREKKENEMKKKFKVTGEEEPMYHARVMVASKVRKNDLPVKSGDTVGIIRTTNCPKGKWLARDGNYKYGYISVMNVELNIKEMLELGKRAQAAGRGVCVEPDTISIGSRSSNHPVLTSSFTDDSEEWAFEDETFSPSVENQFLQQPSSEHESCVHLDAQHSLSHASLQDLHTETRHEALVKLASLFQNNKTDADGEEISTNAETSFLCAVDELPYPEEEMDFSELELLPPPPLYADGS